MVLPMATDDRRIIVFSSRLRPGVEERYGVRAEAVYGLAEKMPGFVSAKDFVSEDGERVSLIEFDSPAHLAAWRNHPDHRTAQREGRSEWYESYRLQICSVLRESRYLRGVDPEPLPEPKASPPERLDAEGGCACGNVRYRVRGRPRFATLCHCADCRRASGASPVAWAVFRGTEVEWLTSRPKERASSDRAFRSFCPDCGAQIAFRYIAYPDFVDLTVASLDDPNLVPPRDHIWTQSKLDWVHLRDELPRHEKDLDVG
jgi:heme-degrading monooxygenase HmoA